jgi:hypothetical protein
MKREHVHFVIVLKRAQLHPGYYANPQPVTGFSRSRNSAYGIVVSERQGLESATRCGFDYLLWWKGAVRGGGVSMEVDEWRPTRRSAHFA